MLTHDSHRMVNQVPRPRGERVLPHAAGGEPITDLLADRFLPPYQLPRRRTCYDRAISKRSRFMTLFQTATKSWTNFFRASEHA